MKSNLNNSVKNKYNLTNKKNHLHINGEIYLVNDSKTNKKFALKQISLKNKTDKNNHKKQFEFLMKLSEENPELIYCENIRYRNKTIR